MMETLTPEWTLSADDFLASRWKGFELIDGRPREMHTGARSSHIVGNLCRLLFEYCEQPFRGWVFQAGASYQLLPTRPNLIRRPDVSFVRPGRFRDEKLPTGHVPFATDLAVEVVSPGEPYYEIDEKLREYRLAGVRLVWVVVPPSRSVLVRRLDESITELHEGDELSGEDVVPGFRCRVADIFHTPAPPQPGA